MFAKIFGQIFDSSIAEDYNCRRMFMDILVLSDSDGVVDMTLEAISRRTNVPLPEVTKYITDLCRPDPLSRSQVEEGRRLIPIDSHREWGWKIVNYEHYREIKDEEARREYFRDKQADYRARKKKDVKKRYRALPSVKDNSTLSKKITHAEAEAEAEEDVRARNKSRTAPVSDEDWKKSLLADIAYRHINVAAEFSKWQRWCVTHKKKPTRARFEAWLNRIETPVSSLPGRRTVQSEKLAAVPIPELTDEQIEKNKAFIEKAVDDLRAKISA